MFRAFPDYKLTRIVMSEELLETDPSLAYRIPHFPSPDWGGEVERVANEGAVWRTMIEAGLGPETANSFVVLASRRQSGPLWPDDQLAAYYSTARRADYASETRVLSQHGTIVFDRRALSDRVALENRSDTRVQLRLERTPWTEGTDFLVLLSRATDKELIDWLGRWTDLLAQEFEPGQPTPIDLLPHNLVALPDGRLRAIDSKFVQNDIAREAVVARGALVTGLQLCAGCDQAEPLGGVHRRGGRALHRHPDRSPRRRQLDRADAVAGEAAFQAEVSLHTPEPPTRAEAVAMQEAVLWEELHLPLALSSQYNPGIGARIALEGGS